jgi:hypothetical protein
MGRKSVDDSVDIDGSRWGHRHGVKFEKIDCDDDHHGGHGHH